MNPTTSDVIRMGAQSFAARIMASRAMSRMAVVFTPVVEPKLFKKPVAAEVTSVSPSHELLLFDSLIVRVWAAAWSEQNAPAVLKLYSPSFQPPGVTGTAEFLDQRREEVTTGPAPAAKVDDIRVTAQSADRRTVTFVQRFGGNHVRKELVLVREGGNWRIVSEKTLESL